MYTRYAVLNPERHFTAGRAEDSILFHKNLHYVQIFVKKNTKYHAATGETGFRVCHQVTTTRTA
jgi:hypothetical protein